MTDRELGLFLGWFIRHYSTETTSDRGLLYYANAMGEEVSIAEILEHYNKETVNTKETHTFVPNKKVSRTESPDSDLIINHNGRTKIKFNL